MALPASEIAVFRSAMRDVNALAQRDLLRSWRQFDLTDAAGVRDGLMDTLPKIADSYHLASSTVAADWYDLMRHDAQVKKKFSAVMPPNPKASRLDALSRWGVSPMFGIDPRPDIALSKISGGLQRIVNDGARQTIVDSSLADPSRVGWMRVTSGGCDFCEMLAGRGAVYGSDSADFDSHDHCQCDAVPEFDEATARILPTNGSIQDALDRFQQQLSDTVATEPTGNLSDAQYEAMRPDSQWSEEKRDRILEELRRTDSGKILADTLDKFQDGGSIGRIRSSIDKYLAGEDLNPTSRARAEALVDALRNAPVDMAPDTLFRGMSIKGSQKSVLAKYNAGAPLDLNLTSFSSDRKIATKFQQMTAKSGTTRVMVEFQGSGKRAIPIQNLARDSRLFKEKEWVGGGRYEIVEVKKSPSGGVILRIKQVGTL